MRSCVVERSTRPAAQVGALLLLLLEVGMLAPRPATELVRPMELRCDKTSGWCQAR